MSGNPFTGMQYVWRGFQNLKTPGLRRYVAFPLLLNIIVMGFASVWGISQLDAWIGQLVDLLPGWLSFLYWILMPLVVIFLVLSLVYFFSAVLMIIAGPLNGLLAERVETLQGYSIPDESIPAMTIRTLGRELTKVGYYLPRYLGIFLLGWIPGVGQLVAPPLWFWFGGWMMAIQYMDLSFDNHTKPFTEVRERLAEDLWTVMGFGLLVALLLTVPIVNLFIMPAAVIGATLMRLERMPFGGDSGKSSYAELTEDVTPRLTHDETEGSGRR